MSDFSTDFDPRSVGWWQRRSVIRQIKRSSWLTAADRDLRLQRARAAHTRGELNALTRDLDIAGVALPQQPLPPASMTQSYGSVPPQAGQPYAPPGQRYPPQPTRAAPPSPKRSARTSLLIGGLVLLVACGGGLVSCVSAIVSSVSDVSSLAPVPDDLQTEDEWAAMVADLDEEIDVETLLEVVVRRHAATITVPDDADSASRYYFDGDLTETTGTGRNLELVEFDLQLVEGDMVESAVAQARQRAAVSESTEAYVRVSATVEDEPTLTVTFPGVAVGYSLEVELDGSIVSEQQTLN